MDKRKPNTRSGDESAITNAFGSDSTRKTFISNQMRYIYASHSAQQRIGVLLWMPEEKPLDLIFGLQCLKNWRNFGIMMFSGLFRASLSSNSDESSQIFCSAPKEPCECTKTCQIKYSTKPKNCLWMGPGSEYKEHEFSLYFNELGLSSFPGIKVPVFGEYRPSPKC
jgi:hypothetical protein